MPLDKKNVKKVIIFSLYPIGCAPGARFRYEQYFAFLSENNVHFSLFPFFSHVAYKNLRKANAFLLLYVFAKGYFFRFWHIVKCLKSEYVYIYRDVTPFFPPIFEWFIAKIIRKKIIYDFDDAIWHTDLPKSQWLMIWLRNPSKTNQIIKWSYKVSCGNAYLCEYAKQFNPSVYLNPTTIDTVNLHNKIKNQETNKPVIGWTGSHSTLKYLEPLVPIIKRLESKFDFEFLVICDTEPKWELKSLRFKPWVKETEIEDLMEINFGLMPLPDDEWANGKCGFKALQYMALGMPALVSPVGVNKEIVAHGVDGFLCTNEEDWYNSISLLLTDENLRVKMGSKTREKIVKKYSVESNKENFLSLFS